MLVSAFVVCAFFLILPAVLGHFSLVFNRSRFHLRYSAAAAATAAAAVAATTAAAAVYGNAILSDFTISPE